jgi:hypothetical protein
MKKIFYIILSLIVIGGACNNKSAVENETQTDDISKITDDYAVETDARLTDINFSETGNITNWDSENEVYTDLWVLTYEQPGAPALFVSLILGDESICVVNNEEYDCRVILDKEFNGKRLHVQGLRDGDSVSVKRITF